ncbi:glucosamine inositolphosphorylceramide transferase family protein [Anaeromyxobacter diazotrophicus]|uniref:Glucosamine inositolphosphorylceramide transferase 1 N-terminal domain-containing protein n=1 Tax=Anaeromyxobacter diazotrophicus TaxID=2590199 RepID=A0A7I9VNR2_9BACT|nr:hypothetical protein [Anaeromyxobacter diazotrophicus]GEJ57617.1 hypothetical protein AMYX_23580 [Anaeromyxobacter diazotrophicus]
MDDRQPLPGRRGLLSKVPGRLPIYSIGIYTGPSPLALASPATGLANPVLTRESVTDHYASFIADPFMIRAGGSWHMFFEALNWEGSRRKGEIAHAVSADAFHWSYQGVVLAEPFHLSYPYVFEWQSERYMIPESSEAGAVRLYRAQRFPDRWTFVKDLLVGPVHLDSSIFHRDGRWWLLTNTDEERGTLHLFHATELLGPWVEHPRSPVVRSDLALGRPAGRVISVGDRLLRFAQDCRQAYGASVAAVEITRLTPTEYEERPLAERPVLAGTGQGWNRVGMHHLDAHQLEDGSWIACVDGWLDRFRRPRELAAWAADHARRLMSS